MKQQAVNPYLPLDEYVPAGEPRVFEDRLYIFGSHDRSHGRKFCMNDYVGWFAPCNNLADWRYEGVIYRKTDDPNNIEICTGCGARTGRKLLYVLWTWKQKTAGRVANSCGRVQ